MFKSLQGKRYGSKLTLYLSTFVHNWHLDHKWYFLQNVGYVGQGLPNLVEPGCSPVEGVFPWAVLTSGRIGRVRDTFSVGYFIQSWVIVNGVVGTRRFNLKNIKIVKNPTVINRFLDSNDKEPRPLLRHRLV